MKRDFPDELPRLAFSTQRANFRPSCQCQPEGNAVLDPSGDLILFLVNTVQIRWQVILLPNSNGQTVFHRTLEVNELGTER